MHAKSIILLFFIWFTTNVTYGQTFDYSYVDPCTGVTKKINVPTNGVTVTYYGQIQTFQPQDFYNGSFENWAQGIYSSYGGNNPCATIVGLSTGVNIAQNTAINFLSIMNSLDALSSLSSGMGSADILNGSVGSIQKPNKKDKDKNKGSESQTSGSSTESQAGSGSSTSGSSTQAGSGSTASGSSTQAGSGSTASGSSTQAGSGSSTQAGSGSSTTGSSTSGSSTSGSSTQAGSGSTNSPGSSTQAGSGSSNTGGSSTQAGSGSSNTGGSSSTTGSTNSQGSSTSGSSTQAGSGSSTTGSSNSGGSSSTTGSSTQSSSGNSSEQSGSGSGSGTETQEAPKDDAQGKTNIVGGSVSSMQNSGSNAGGKNGNRPTILASSDFVGFNFKNSDVTIGGKFTGGYTSLRWDGKRSHGFLVDYTTALKGPNVTGFYAFMKKKRIDLISTTLTAGFDVKPSFYGTLALGQMWNIGKKKKLKAVYMLTGSFGSVYGETFTGTAAIAGVMYDLKLYKRIEIKLMGLYVYAPYVSYYNDILLKSPHVVLPIIGTNIGITKRFKLNINAGGAWAINENALNYTVMMGTRFLL